MATLSEKKQRYLRDPVAIRLGGLAANLARVKSFSKNLANNEAVFNLFEETKHFIEWTAIETEIVEQLVEYQIQIAVWQRKWKANWNNEKKRNEMSAISSEWSQKILESSGLLR
jgi:hypothetical protein